MTEALDANDGNEMRPLEEVLMDLREHATDLRDRAAMFIRGLVPGEVGIVYDEADQRSSGSPSGDGQSGQQQPPAPVHVCGTVCSRCGKGGGNFSGRQKH